MRGNGLAGLLVFNHPGSGYKIVQCLFIRKGFEDFAPDPKIEPGERDEVDQKKRDDDREHETDLKGFIDEKVLPAILGHRLSLDVDTIEKENICQNVIPCI